MRADVNVSVRRAGEPYRTRCEVKNVNSIRFVMQAIEAEAARQVEVWESDQQVQQETRLFDSARGVTRSMRSKEDAHDYRYFPDPDLPALRLEQDWVAALKASLPELPDEKKARFIAQYGLTPYEAGVLVAERSTADFFEAVAKDRDAKLAANWMLGDVFAFLNRAGLSLEASPITVQALGSLLDLIADRTINGRIAKDVFQMMVETGKLPTLIVEEQGWRQVTDTGAIESAIDDILAKNADKVAEYRAGREKLFGFFVGQTMKVMGGKGNPALINEVLKNRLAGG